jgi:DNA-directed DNA polymerase III PolC
MFSLFVRSYYSLMRGCSSPARLCRRAKELGYGGLALTDRDSLAGLWDFLAACKQYGLRPLVGAEITDPGSAATVTCLVRNSTGYINLCNLISKRKVNKTFSLQQELVKHSNGLIIVTSSLSLLTILQKHTIDLAANLGSRPTEESSRIRKWAQQVNVPAVAIPAVHMAEEDEKALLQLMEAIRTNSLLDIRGQGPDNSSAWLEAPAVYHKRLGVWPEVAVVTEHLLKRGTFSGPDVGIVMPPWEAKESGAAVSLQKAAYRGACTRYGTDLSENVVERLEKELRVIDSMGFSSYFLVVRDIVHQALSKSTKGSSRICGRGSGAASLVAYCLEITNVCPVKHNLYFERFLNPGRTDPPDIDIDFAWDERDAVLDQVLQKYGSHAAMVSTIIRFQPRMALRETARAFGLPPGEISQVSKLSRLPGSGKERLAEPWLEIMKLSSGLIGVPRHLSVHPGGVIITPEPVSNYVPVEIASKGVPVIQWDKDGAEEGGLVKIDLLGNRSLGVIRDCIASLADSGRSFAEEYWQPEEDLQTRKAVAAGKTMGCFYIESPAMRLLQQKAGSGDFEQLVLQSSIIRPAANDFVREYVRRLHGGEWQHLHPKLAMVLDETFGLMVYQEDVSRVAVALAGFSHARADGLRKVMSKKDKVLRLKDYRMEFEKGCADRGVDRKTRGKLWEMMMSFDGYSFCKPHSASYARVSYQAAYLKTHYPAEFMAAVISNQGGYYSTFAYVSEAKRLGLRILHPCVNRSRIRWNGEGNAGKAKDIRVGLMAVKNLSTDTMARILRCRKEKKFVSNIDFWQRVQPQKDECRSLIQAGAMDDVSTENNKNRSRLFWELSQFRCLAKVQKSSPLFGLQLPQAPALSPFNSQELQEQEYEVLEFLCNDHPLLHYGWKLKGRTRACDIKQYTGKRIRFAGWLLSGKLVSTKSGEVMEFLTFEDETGVVETTFFPQVYRRYAAVLSSGYAYMLQGKVEEEYGAVTLTVDGLQKLGQYPVH